MRVQFGHVCCASWTNGQQHGTHASGKKLHTEYDYTSTCTRRSLYSYSSTALTISGCGQWEAAGTIRATSYEDRHTCREARRLRSTCMCRSGRPPASSPSARSADSERSSARSRASAPVAPRRPPRSHKQSASPSSVVHLLGTEVRSATHAVKSIRTQRDVDESRALNTKHRVRSGVRLVFI